MWERYGGEGFADGAVAMLLPCCWGAAAGKKVAERNLHGAVSMLFAAVGVQLLGREVAERNLRTVLFPMLFAAVGVEALSGQVIENENQLCARGCLAQQKTQLTTRSTMATRFSQRLLVSQIIQDGISLAKGHHLLSHPPEGTDIH